MRLPPLRFLLCSAALYAGPAFSQSAPQPSPVSPSTPHDSRTQIPALTWKPAITIVLPPHINLLSHNSTCYVIDSRQFPQSGSNFDPIAPTTHTVCQPAPQYRLKDATATPIK